MKDVLKAILVLLLIAGSGIVPLTVIGRCLWFHRWPTLVELMAVGMVWMGTRLAYLEDERSR